MKWPVWWEWELELSSHLEKRMEERGFSEVELREMLEHARGHSEAGVEGRWAIATSHAGRRWEVIVEPDSRRELLVVITAYWVES